MSDSITNLFQCRYGSGCIHPDKQRDGWLPLTSKYFFRNKRNKTGFQYACKKCQRTMVKKWAQEHPEAVRRYNHRWRDTHLEYDRERNRIYRLNNLEQEREKDRLYIQNNPEKVRRKGQRRRKNKPEQSRLYCANRRALKLKAVGTHSVSDLKKQYQRQKGKCFYCNDPLNHVYHEDHVVPLTRGGSNDMANIVLACPGCNQSKGNKLLHEWKGGGGRLL